ncbi:hypothetical protein BCR34DRAFT_288230 [Clohesyomyces aquaticus]|uniref:Uncharacterized protein n=1 Tax=Clohesyomyces aquaticus TaxID=1231657 RepID=A0A1Y1ZRA9_9PLEO|nr:hypothetical protein BCR34DRAFT_288230 [Clohesyomyces aquaticus]
MQWIHVACVEAPIVLEARRARPNHWRRDADPLKMIGKRMQERGSRHAAQSRRAQVSLLVFVVVQHVASELSSWSSDESESAESLWEQLTISTNGYCAIACCPVLLLDAISMCSKGRQCISFYFYSYLHAPCLLCRHVQNLQNDVLACSLHTLHHGPNRRGHRRERSFDAPSLHPAIVLFRKSTREAPCSCLHPSNLIS